MRKLSPTANLLRNSRLFSIPPPLPRPAPDFTGIANFDSETSTSSYPTQQAIETSEKSLARGDWGLKRNLPLKTTTKSTAPTIKIRNVDSIELITDFGSSSDHVRTLDKWQEMDLPISTMIREKRVLGDHAPLKSVFDSDLDNTAFGDDNEQARWKFEGPWIAGLEDGAFESYLTKRVGKRKAEFREFLRERLRNLENAIRRREMLEKGEDSDIASENETAKAQISEAALDRYVRSLRKDEDTLTQILKTFLDLPRDSRAHKANMGRASYDDKGPPTTHPSGGLSYLRTSAHTYNHPLYGPQEDKTPIEARVLIPQGEAGKAKRRAAIGIGGIVADDHRQPFGSGDDSLQVERFDPDLTTGGKVLVEPKRANIDVEGRIELGTTRAEKNAVRVFNSDRGQFKTPEIPRAAIDTMRNRRMGNLAPPIMLSGGSETNSYGVEDLKSMSPRGQAKKDQKEPDLAALFAQLHRNSGSIGK